MTVYHHHMRLARGGHFADIQARVVVQHRANAGQHRTGARPPRVAIGAGSRRGDPLAGAVQQCRGAVQRCRRLEANPGCATDHATEESDIELARLGRTRADFYFDARSAQPRKALAGNQRIGVCNRRHHLGNARRRQRIAARPRAPLVCAGLQGDISCCAAHILPGSRRIAQRHDFGVRAAGLLGRALADYPAIRCHQHAAHAGVGVGKKKRLTGQRQTGVDGR